MSYIYVPSRGREDWQRLFAKPEKQWRDGYILLKGTLLGRQEQLLPLLDQNFMFRSIA